MCEVIVVTSGKGGVGKTTTSANVGTGLAKMGKKVCLIDTDIGLRNLDVVMGLENRIVYNLVDVIEGNCRIKQALIRDKKHPGLYLMPSAQTKDKSSVTPGQMVKVIDGLKEQFDYIILDCPAGIEQGFQNAIAGAGRALVVTTPEVSAIRDADRIVGLLEANGFKQIDLIINRLRIGIKSVTFLLDVGKLGIAKAAKRLVVHNSVGNVLQTRKEFGLGRRYIAISPAVIVEHIADTAVLAYKHWLLSVIDLSVGKLIDKGMLGKQTLVARTYRIARSIVIVKIENVGHYVVITACVDAGTCLVVSLRRKISEP